MPAPVQQLFSILADHDLDLTRDDWHVLLDVARVHGVLPFLAQRVLARNTALPADVAERLQRVQADATERNTRRLRDFASAVRALQGRGIDVIALKGTHLISLVYRNLASRTMTDLDILIPRTKLEDAADALRELGYDVAPFRITPNDPVPYFSYTIPNALHAKKSTIDVHWHLHNPRSAASIDVDELWSRATTVRIAGVDVRVLAPEDLLLHVAEHATYGHRCEISARACCDVAEIIHRNTIDWDALIDRAQRWKMAPGSYLMLRLAREMRNATVPDEVLAALKPDVFDERLLHIALRGEEGQKAAVHRLRYSRGIRAKLKTIRDFWFVSRNELADLHRIDRNSPLVYGLYLIRPFRFLRRLPEVAAEFRGDGRTASEVAVIDSFLGDSRR